MTVKEDEPEIAVVDVVVEPEIPVEVKNEIDPLNSGFYWYTPPHGVNKEGVGGHEWVISGHDMQIITSTVPAGEQVVTEVGSFMYMAPFMKTKVEMTLCSGGGCGEGWSRICGGESCVKVFLINDSDQEGFVGLTPSYPAKIMPVKFGTHIPADSVLLAQGGAIMSQIGDVQVGCDCDCSFIRCCCAGLGICRQKLQGSQDSIAFLAAGGTIVYRNLEENETIVVDKNSVVAFEQSVQLGVAPNGRCCVCLCGGEGCCSATLTGPGKVFLQSSGFQKLRNFVQSNRMDRGEGSGGGGGGAAAAAGGAVAIGGLTEALLSD